MAGELQRQPRPGRNGGPAPGAPSSSSHRWQASGASADRASPSWSAPPPSNDLSSASRPTAEWEPRGSWVPDKKVFALEDKQESLEADEEELRQALLGRKKEKARRKEEEQAVAEDDAGAVVGTWLDETPMRLIGKQPAPNWYHGRFIQAEIARNKAAAMRRPAVADVLGKPAHAAAASAGCAGVDARGLLCQPVFLAADKDVKRNVFTCRWYDRETRAVKKAGLGKEALAAHRKTAMQVAGMVYDAAMKKMAKAK